MIQEIGRKSIGPIHRNIAYIALNRGRAVERHAVRVISNLARSTIHTKFVQVFRQCSVPRWASQRSRLTRGGTTSWPRQNRLRSRSRFTRHALPGNGRNRGCSRGPRHSSDRPTRPTGGLAVGGRKGGCEVPLAQCPGWHQPKLQPPVIRRAKEKGGCFSKIAEPAAVVGRCIVHIRQTAPTRLVDDRKQRRLGVAGGGTRCLTSPTIPQRDMA